MSDNSLFDDLAYAEGLLLQDRDEEACDLLLRLAEDAEEYVDRNCPTTQTLQWFSFPSIFERLCYRRVEEDPRELRDVGEPLDRLYADLALANVKMGAYEHAVEALKQAVRWNPMECSYRLDLAELLLVEGNASGAMGLAFSVFERASDARHLVRAYVLFASWFERSGNPRAAAAALRAAQRLDMPEPTLAAALDRVRDTPCDPSTLDDEATSMVLEEEGLPSGANAEVAVCLLMCAMDMAAMGQRDVATTLMVRARDLVGDAAAKALLQLIQENDDEAEGEGGAHADE